MATPSSGGIPEFVSGLISKVSGSDKQSVPQAIAGTMAFSVGTVSDSVWDVLPNVDPALAGPVATLGAVGLTALVQAANAPRKRRNLRLRVLADPQRLLQALLRAGEVDLATEYVRLVELYRDGFITKAQLGRRLEEILNDLVERPPPSDELS